MNIESYKNEDEIKEAIERRLVELDRLRIKRDKPFEGYHFQAGEQYRRTERNYYRLKAKLEGCKVK